MIGANGAGKTNLLEALHVSTQGFSPRTRIESQAIRFGCTAARATVRGQLAGVAFETVATLRQTAVKELRADGLAVTSDELRARFPVLVFTPDRLAVVKGGPIVRRTYFDRMLGRLRPEDGALPGEYARSLAQRNAALRRVRQGLGPLAAVEPWTAAIAALGQRLDDARARLVVALEPAFADVAERLGLPEATLGYVESGITPETLDARLSKDVERGATGVGPHLQDVSIAARGSDLRTFGSQGQQRMAVLALVLAEAREIVGARGVSPVLLLDDVLSELDANRRASLLAQLPAGAQTVITATSADALAAQIGAADSVIRVEPGSATRVAA